MLRIRTGVIVLLLSLGLQGAGSAGCGTKRNEAQQNVNQSNNNNVANNNALNNNAVAEPTPGRVEEAVSDELKILAGGAYGKVNDAFVVVARDAETYAALRELVDNLPQVSADFFKKNIVVAAFLGQRRTGGYGVEITLAENNRLRVSSTSPPAGSMTTQALTAPFKVISIPDLEHRSLSIEIGPAWNNETRPYRVSSGDFTTGGGFAGRIERLQLAGDIRVSRLGKLATFVFDLKSSGGA
ncbi:MAG TPA: protease complex subunit PrcB family protein, partial [Pyrinomonadaceae bacterium]|nr:protease complex subunit PrcB family protein [Pyrinomonadaceae bacterium]